MNQGKKVPALATLLEGYKQLAAMEGTTQRDLAVMEDELWGARREEDLHIARPVWLVKVTGGAAKHVDMRSQIYSAEPDTKVLWPRVENGGDMTPSTAIQVMRDARRMRAEQHISFEEAVRCALADYDALPVATRVSDGRVVRKKAHGNAYTRATSEPPPSSERVVETGEPVTDRPPWWQIRDLVHNMVDARLAMVDELVRERVRQELDNECKLFVSTLQTCLHNATQRARKEHHQPVTMGMLKQACEILALDPPSRSSALDETLLQAWFTQAKNAKNRLVRQYHPDTRGDDKTRVQYEETMRAYELARRYFDEQLPRARSTKEEQPNGNKEGKR